MRSIFFYWQDDTDTHHIDDNLLIAQSVKMSQGNENQIP